MTVLDTRSKDTIVGAIAAGMQSQLSSAFLNFAKGKALRAIAEAYAGVCLWLQKEIIDDAKLTRLATSYGPDADSWIADFGIITRIGAIPATGLVTFSRYTASGAAPVVPVGAAVKTQDGSQTFLVYADTTNGAYSATANGYVMPAQVASVIVPVQAVNLGSQGNVAAGSISLIGSQITGVDTVTNPAAFTNGSDQESDEALKDRFPLAIASLSKGTDTAIENAVEAIKTGMQVQVLDSLDLSGATDYGMVTVIVDDGSGNISSDLLAACQNAVSSVRAAGIRFGVYAATITTANVQLTLNVKPGYYRPTVVAQLDAALGLAINSLGLGEGLSYFGVGAWSYAVAGVASIDNLTINGGTSDIAPSPLETIKTGSVIIN